MSAQTWPFSRQDLVGEVSRPGQVQRDARGSGSRGHFVVTDRTTRVHNGFHTGVGQGLQTVGEREECIGGSHGAANPVTAPLHREPRRVDLLMSDFSVTVVEDDYAALTGCAAYLAATS